MLLEYTNKIHLTILLLQVLKIREIYFFFFFPENVLTTPVLKSL